MRKTFCLISAIILMASALFIPGCALAWSNGGYSADKANPDYGTHDWIAQHALSLLPQKERQYLDDNLATYLLGTEWPDNPEKPEGYGDTTKHHVYYYANGTLQDNASAKRAGEEYQKALGALRAHDLANASRFAGAMSHYIDDMAVFAHVMGKYTDWGAETHHSDYEDWVNSKTKTYNSSDFSITPDGTLNNITAYQAALELAYDSTFDISGDKDCLWMDANPVDDDENPTRAYDTDSQAFKDRVSQSLNLAVNKLADVLHSLAWEASYNGTDTPSPADTGQPEKPLYSNPYFIGVVIAIAIALLLTLLFKKKGKKRRRK